LSGRSAIPVIQVVWYWEQEASKAIAREERVRQILMHSIQYHQRAFVNVIYSDRAVAFYLQKGNEQAIR
jgi:hypothetical protein